MDQETIEKIEDILRAYQNDVLSDMVIEQMLILLQQMEPELLDPDTFQYEL